MKKILDSALDGVIFLVVLGVILMFFVGIGYLTGGTPNDADPGTVNCPTHVSACR